MRDVFDSLPTSTSEEQIRHAPAAPRYTFPGDDPDVDREAERLVQAIDALDARVHAQEIDDLSFFVELVRLGVFRLDSLGRVWRRWAWHDARKCLVRLREEVRGDIIHTRRWTMCVEWKWTGGDRRRVEAHRLVYHLLVGPLEHPNMLIHHVNNIKSDNRPSNLSAPRVRDRSTRAVADVLRRVRG